MPEKRQREKKTGFEGVTYGTEAALDSGARPRGVRVIEGVTTDISRVVIKR
jgi:hypothetical protein